MPLVFGIDTSGNKQRGANETHNINTKKLELGFIF